jgi:hypothetical protein
VAPIQRSIATHIMPALFAEPSPSATATAAATGSATTTVTTPTSEKKLSLALSDDSYGRISLDEQLRSYIQQSTTLSGYRRNSSQQEKQQQQQQQQQAAQQLKQKEPTPTTANGHDLALKNNMDSPTGPIAVASKQEQPGATGNGKIQYPFVGPLTKLTKVESTESSTSLDDLDDDQPSTVSDMDQNEDLGPLSKNATELDGKTPTLNGNAHYPLYPTYPPTPNTVNTTTTGATRKESSSQSSNKAPDYLNSTTLPHPLVSSSISLNSATLFSSPSPTATAPLPPSPTHHRHSSPPVPSPHVLAAASAGLGAGSSSTAAGSSTLRNRQNLLAPRLTTPRLSRDYSMTGSMNSEDHISTTTGRFSPTVQPSRRASFSLARLSGRGVQSETHVDEILQDEDATRYAETVLQRRANRRKAKLEEDDDKVVVGTKVDQNHVNWVTAYNMLTGIRFVVSRTNAKIDRPLTENDFLAKHKFSFDVTGNELTPSARYDFKFKDYAPWVFRHLRVKFGLDPAEYLVSLTSKYILSELGSPGKSGSFFYFSRDYKYIIKTIHQSEHKVLRRILKDYYNHVEQNQNTLISQFYGLHRVKTPFGRKIHFVVMNNLFPPHRDIHQTFDLKGSTIGRDFKEVNLPHNPRATLKDLNWLRRNMHLELGPLKRSVFLAQVERDVELLKRLKIMDYSLLVGIHDLEKGNEEELRNKTLRVFEPGGEHNEELQTQALMRTPSKMETMRKARELRKLINSEKPIPLEKSTSRMPDEFLDKTDHTFYSDDGGFRATHGNDTPDDAVYYLGIIDCLTHVSDSILGRILPV